MKAYAIVQETVKDEAMFAEYRKHVMATLEPFNARFLVRGGKMSVVEGTWPHPRLVVIEFPSRQAAEDWYRSPAYQKVLPLRLKAADGNFVIVDGAD